MRRIKDFRCTYGFIQRTKRTRTAQVIDAFGSLFWSTVVEETHFKMVFILYKAEGLF